MNGTEQEAHLEKDFGPIDISQPRHQSLVHQHQPDGFFALLNAHPQLLSICILAQWIRPQTLGFCPAVESFSLYRAES